MFFMPWVRNALALKKPKVRKALILATGYPPFECVHCKT